MLVPDIAYSYQFPRDVASGTLQMVQRSVTDSDMATVVAIAIFRVPVDSILILSHLSWYGNPGASQTVSNMQIDYMLPSGQLFIILNDRGWKAQFNTQRGETYPGTQIWLPGGNDETVADAGRLRFQGSFNAGVNANTIFASMAGLLIPKANAQLA